MATNNEFEVVNEDTLEFSKRGRKSKVNPALVEAIGKLRKGQALKLSGMRVNLTDPKAKTEKARVSATIRQAGKQAGKKVGIRWSTTGIPQVVLI